MQENHLTDPCLQRPALGDDNGLFRFVCAVFGDILNLLNHIVTLDDLAKDHVFPIQPSSHGGSDEELRA